MPITLAVLGVECAIFRRVVYSLHMATRFTFFHQIVVSSDMVSSPDWIHISVFIKSNIPSLGDAGYKYFQVSGTFRVSHRQLACSTRLHPHGTALCGAVVMNAHGI